MKHRRLRDLMRLPWQAPPPSQAEVADEFLAFLQREWPQLNARDCDGDSLALTLPDGAEGKLFLHKLHAAIARLRRNNSKWRQLVYADFAQQMLASEKQIPDLNALGEDEIAKIIFPRVMPRDTLTTWTNQLRAQAGSESEPEAPHRDLPGTNFMIAYVLDFDDRVAYFMGHQSQMFNLDEPSLFERAMNNSRELFTREHGRAALEQISQKKAAVCVECPDNHASARLLLLPEYLEEGEEFAAVILENGAFLVSQIPPQNNWNPLREVARQGGSPHVHQPFLVTKSGIKAM